MNAPYHWSELTIRNYKSIGELHLACSRINVFIGPPNSGKSNILEALELPKLTFYMQTQEKVEQPMANGYLDCKRHFRVDSAFDFFPLAEVSHPVMVSGFLNGTQPRKFLIRSNFERIEQQEDNNFMDFIWENGVGQKVPFSKDFIRSKGSRYAFLGSSYRYKDILNLFESQDFYHGQLQPPNGINLGTTIRLNPSLQALFAQELKESNGAELVVDKASGRLSIQYRTEQGLGVTLPFYSLSDTVRRMIFYTAAIRTSLDDILILEEPEALSFPPYITRMALEIVEASEQKQFFIATHSPYLLNTLIEQTPKENLSVFVCSYQKEERQTKARKLSDQDLREVLDYGLDVFFNLDPYRHEEESESGV